MSSLKPLILLPALLLIASCGNSSEKIDIKTPPSSGTKIQMEKSNTNRISSNMNVNTVPLSDKETIAPENQSNELDTKNLSVAIKVESCRGIFRNQDTTQLGKTDQTYWNNLLKKFYPTFPGVFVADVCTLNNGQMLVTAGLDGYYQPTDSEESIKQQPYKKVILFDKNHRHILSTTGLTCPNVGDTSAPVIDEKNSFKENFIYVTCNGGDAGHSFTQTIRINIKDFSFGMIKEVSTAPAEGYITGDENQVYIETTRELQSDGTWKVTEKKI